MNDDRFVALEQIVAELELLSLEEQIWLVERLTDRILVQMDQPKMAIVTPKVNPVVQVQDSTTTKTEAFDVQQIQGEQE
ncbi:MAG: hypothetical protein NT070_05285 [Cyanobacteria bacterium]|nr:hypothetical protein [Cyanobacteriota bacterium]